MNNINLPIKNALISLSDKTGLIKLAKKLHNLNIRILSTDGTAKIIKKAGIPVKNITDLTKFPEIMDGKIKTLHPIIHGGLLALRNNEKYNKIQKKFNIINIDLLIVNLYPFELTYNDNNYKNCIKNIDIGGPAMIRSAAKNYNFVTVIVENNDFNHIINEIENNNNTTTLETRKKLAAKAYARTAAYDASISNWFINKLNTPISNYFVLGGSLKQTLRYGENPHQTASFYTDKSNPSGISNAIQLQGKKLTYNNINDTNAAFELISEFNPNKIKAVAIIKHTNPCGVGTSIKLINAYKAAYACDPLSAFGGIVALNYTININVANEIIKTFTEVIIAPSITDEAKMIISTKKNIRLLIINNLLTNKSTNLNVNSVLGGFIVQSRDISCIEEDKLNIVTKRQPSVQELVDMKIAFKICKHIKSNAIVYVKNGSTIGIGAGQMSRIDSTYIANYKKNSLIKNFVIASDAFLPFVDSLLIAITAGATAVIQPGGSIRDNEIIKAANDANLTMIFTNIRNFKH